MSISEALSLLSRVAMGLYLVRCYIGQAATTLYHRSMAMVIYNFHMVTFRMYGISKLIFTDKLD